MPNLADHELSTLRDLMTELCPNLALALAEQINSELTLNVDTVTAVPIGELQDRSDNVFTTTFSLASPLTADSLLVLSQETACVCFDLLKGNAGSSPPASLKNEEAIALAAAFDGMIRGLATALATRLGNPMEVETCISHLAPLSLPPGFALNDKAAQVELTFVIPDLHTATMTFLLTPDWVQALIAASNQEEPASSDNLSEHELSAMLNGIGEMGTSSASLPGGSNMASAPFASFPTSGLDSSMPRGMELIMDIPLEVTVELGRVRMLIRDVLELASGSIVELDRVAGEPVDLMVNGRLVAKGEVVVIEDNFGIRLTEIVSPADRVAGLGRGR
jgi:flagellar motor switch protein FliN/FliY